MTYMELSLEQKRDALTLFKGCVIWDPSAFDYTVDRAGHIAQIKRQRALVMKSDRICGQCLGIILDDARDCPACKGVTSARDIT